MKKLLISITLISALLFPSTLVFATEGSSTAPAGNAPTTANPTGSTGTTGTTGTSGTSGTSTSAPTWENYVPQSAKTVDGLDKATKNIINILLLLAGMVAVIYIIIGGYSYITASGNADAAAAAKNTILNALIGLIVVFGAYAIVKWVLGKFIG